MDKHIRWMIRRDMARVLEIEDHSFEFPWTEDEFIRLLRQRNCIGMVIDDLDNDNVSGYMIYELHKHRLHLLNMAVDKPRCGLGTMMVDRLIGKLSVERRQRITLEIGERNLDGQLFFREMGFLAKDIVCEFFDNDDDAYVMEYLINSRETSEAPY